MASEADSPKPAGEGCTGCAGNWGEHKAGCTGGDSEAIVVAIAASIFKAAHPYLLSSACQVARTAFGAGRREGLRLAMVTLTRETQDARDVPLARRVGDSLCALIDGSDK